MAGDMARGGAAARVQCVLAPRNGRSTKIRVLSAPGGGHAQLPCELQNARSTARQLSSMGGRTA